jgi:hypothetical protein
MICPPCKANEHSLCITYPVNKGDTYAPTRCDCQHLPRDGTLVLHPTDLTPVSLSAILKPGGTDGTGILAGGVDSSGTSEVRHSLPLDDLPRA